MANVCRSEDLSIVAWSVAVVGVVSHWESGWEVGQMVWIGQSVGVAVSADGAGRVMVTYV